MRTYLDVDGFALAAIMRCLSFELGRLKLWEVLYLILHSRHKVLLWSAGSFGKLIGFAKRGFVNLRIVTGESLNFPRHYPQS